MSCGPKNTSIKKSSPPGLPDSLQMGTSSASDVENELGQPLKTYKVEEASAEATMYNYQDNKTFKFESNVVKGFFRDPNKDEIYLQYWMQKWKDKKVEEVAVEGTKNVHGQSEYQMINEEEKTTIIFDKENAIVKRVMYYEK